MEKLVQTFRKVFEVHYYEVNPFQELTPLSLLNYLEEAAIAHSESVGFGVDRLKTEGYGWVLNHWQIEVDQYPKLGEKVLIETWPSRIERFYADREFLVKNADEDVIARASSLWVFLHLHKRRPLRIPKEIGEAYPVLVEKALSQPFSDFQFKQLQELEPKEFFVRRSDIDTNAHVNNAKYVEWLLETIPEEVYSTYRLTSLDVAYKKESIYGQQIRCHTEDEGSPFGSSLKGFLHRIASVEAEAERETEQECALARTRWERRTTCLLPPGQCR